MNYWFRDIDEETLFIDEHVLRARAGLLIFLPIFLAFSFFYFNSMFTTQWDIVKILPESDWMDANEEGQQLYVVEAIKRTYDYTYQTYALLFGLFEILMGLSKHTVRFSPTIRIATWMTRNSKPYYTPYSPKKFAWVIGVMLISTCIVFFNPRIIPIEDFIIPIEVGFGLLFTCFSFIWLELTFGYCVGCELHALLVKLGIFKYECYDCKNI